MSIRLYFRWLPDRNPIVVSVANKPAAEKMVRDIVADGLWVGSVYYPPNQFYRAELLNEPI
jgi:hypothetical protein